MKYAGLIKEIKDILLPVCGEYADYEAGKIVRLTAETDSARLFAALHDEVPPNVVKKSEDIAKKRLRGEPLEYIIKKADFFGSEFYVDRRVLVPQADTEVIVEKAVSLARSGMKIADICCGSGCIGLSVLKNTENTTADMFDISDGACEITVKNAAALGLADRANVLCRDVFSNGFFDGRGKYDMIISNPPYIRTDVIGGLSPEVKSEPHIALDGGEDGLRFYHRLFDICPGMLSDGGIIIFEIGYDQAEKVTSEGEKRGFFCEAFRDYGGNFRCVTAKKL